MHKKLLGPVGMSGAAFFLSPEFEAVFFMLALI